MAEIQERMAGGLRSFVNNALQGWFLKAVITVGLTAWTVFKGYTADVPTAYLIMAAVVVAAGTAHILILLDAWRRSASVEYRLQSAGYPFNFNSVVDEAGRVTITEGAPPIQLANTSSVPIHFRFNSLRVVIDGKTNEDMYGKVERECYKLPPNFAIGFATKIIKLGVAAPGYMGGVVEFEVAYGKSPKRLRYKLKRKYKLHLYIAENGQISTNGGELDVSIPMEEPVV